MQVRSKTSQSFSESLRETFPCTGYSYKACYIKETALRGNHVARAWEFERIECTVFLRWRTTAPRPCTWRRRTTWTPRPRHVLVVVACPLCGSVLGCHQLRQHANDGTFQNMCGIRYTVYSYGQMENNDGTYQRSGLLSAGRAVVLSFHSATICYWNQCFS